MSIADEVDAALAGLRAVLGTGNPPTPAAPKDISAAPIWPAWTGTVSIAAQDASNDLDRLRTRVHFDQSAAVALIKHASSVITNARTRMEAVQAGWGHDKDALAPIADTPLGQISLKQAGQRRLSEGGGVVRDAMTELGSTATKLELVASDLPLLPRQAPTPHTLNDLLLPPGDPQPAADESKRGEGGEKEKEGIDLNPSGSDIALGAEGAIAGGTTDAVRQATMDAVKVGTGPGAADPWLLKWFEDSKVPGFSRVGGLVGVVAAVPAVISDVSKDNNSVAEAVMREGAGVAGGMLAGGWAGAEVGAAVGSVIPGAGTAVGLVVGAGVGAVASFVASKGVEAAWQPVSNAVGDAVHGVESIFGFG